jgi:uncharacterized glyoxalase superfamily protein PhnB
MEPLLSPDAALRSARAGGEQGQALALFTMMSICKPGAVPQLWPATSNRWRNAMAVNAKPPGYHVVTPYLVVDGAARLIDFLEETFDAREVERFAAPGNRVGHAELRIGDSVVMLGDAHGEHKPMPAMLYVYVEDCDATYQRALSAGATAVQPPADQFYGDRSGGVRDPVGNLWWIATHIEDVTPAELKRRAEVAMQRDRSD